MRDMYRAIFFWRQIQDAQPREQDDRTQAVQLMPGEHHWRHGITFKRLQQRLKPDAPGNGDVQLCVGGLIFRIPAAEWVSIITEVSAAGSYPAGHEFHMDESR